MGNTAYLMNMCVKKKTAFLSDFLRIDNCDAGPFGGSPL